MAQVIEFYIPANFKPETHWTAPGSSGKLLEFPAVEVQEAWRGLIAELDLWAEWR
jgi:hypothetical protein